MNYPLFQSKFGKRYRDNFDATFGKKPLYEKPPMSEEEKHIRHCPVCRVATTKAEMCPVGQKFIGHDPVAYHEVNKLAYPE